MIMMLKSSDPLSRLLCALVTDRLGQLAGQVVAGVLSTGTARLGQIASKAGLSVKTVRSCLGVLNTHRMLQLRSVSACEQLL